ncbi:hypothetical protein BpHYR1_022366 [Brachionus plicatilis]|uniref:Uncharacterized protein n=1 Tax=Brachionus plicatilis TaxID=10195 RepID=A0A3M7PR12_BRAPC|nr:hypothetical protein BpHYR1_022366 [Brachionus plicatilis]
MLSWLEVCGIFWYSVVHVEYLGTKKQNDKYHNYLINSMPNYIFHHALVLPYGFLLNKSSVGGSVAKANEAKVSMIKLTHNI